MTGLTDPTRFDTIEVERRSLRVVPFLFWALPVVIGLVYIARYAVNVPVGEDWRFVGTLERYLTGHLEWSELWRPDGQDGALVRLVMLWLARLTHYDTRAMMALSLLCGATGLGAVLVVLRQNMKDLRAWFFVPLPFLMLSLQQHGNLLDASRLGTMLTQMFAVLTVAALHRASGPIELRFRGIAFGFALLCAVCASLSTLEGVLLWPVGMLQLALSATERRLKWVGVALWSVVGLLTCIGYARGYPLDSLWASASVVLRQPLQPLLWSLTAVGHVLVDGRVAALVVGIAIIALAVLVFVAVARHGARRTQSAWIALFAFSVAATLLSALGPAGVELEKSLASTQVSLSLLSVVSLFAISAGLWLEHRTRLPQIGILLLWALIVVSLPISVVGAIGAGRRSRLERQQQLSLLANYTRNADALSRLDPSVDRLLRRARFLFERRYSVFAHRARQTVGGVRVSSVDERRSLSLGELPNRLGELPIAFEKAYRPLYEVKLAPAQLSHFVPSGASRYRPSGPDPWLLYTLPPRLLSGGRATRLLLEVVCHAPKGPLIELYWASETSSLSERDSIRFRLTSRRAVIPLDLHPGWRRAEWIRSIRVDLADPKSCEMLEISRLAFFAPR
ncbi:MAG: hypothetical protein KC609_19830 [Myxococcales bacterium]|nr:hypothetical protein [Myxococcales bacterium]